MEKIKNFLFINTNTKQTVIKNTFWLFVGEMGIKVLKALIFIYAIRKLGTTQWGLFSYVFAIMTFFNIISDIGLNSVLTKKTALNDSNQNKYISTSFILKLGLSLLSSLALLSVLFFIKDDNIKNLIPIATILLFFDTMKCFGFSLNQAFEKMEIEAIIKITSSLILIISGFFFIKTNPTASSLFYAYVLSSVLGIFILFLNLKKYFKNIISNFSKNLLFPIWKEAWPIGIAAALGTIMSSIDIVILGWFNSTEQIGLYSTAQKPIQALCLAPSLIGVALLPVFSRFALNNKEKMKHTTKRMVAWSYFFTIPIVIFCILLGGPIFSFIFGHEYDGAILIFKIMSLTIITSAPSFIISKAIFADGNQKKLIQFILISIIINTILCLITIPYLGIYGAALSVTIAQTIGNMFLIIKYNKLLN